MTNLGAHVDDLQELLAAVPEIVTAYLFGSAVEATADASDLDVAVVLVEGHDDLSTVLALQARLEAALDVPIDLHELDRLPVDLQFRIVQTGTILVDRDSARRVSSEIAIVKAHDDFRPYLELIRSSTRERLASGAAGG